MCGLASVAESEACISGIDSSDVGAYTYSVERENTMSEQRVVYLHDSSVEGLVKQMNGLFDMGGPDGTEIESIEHFAIVRDGDELWKAVVLVNLDSTPGIRWRYENGVIEAQQEYETVIGVKSR
jgi:hypothetical protein